MIDCVVVGGGISGLALAHALMARRLDVALFEAAPRAGGKIASVAEAGFVYERGPAAFFDRSGAVGELARAAGAGAAVVEAGAAAARRGVAVGGRLYEVPRGARAIARSPLLSPFAKLRLVGDVVLPPVVGEATIAAVAQRRLGVAGAERLFYPRLPGLYAGDPERISFADAFPQLAARARRQRSLLRALDEDARAMRARGARLRSFADGMETLPRAVAAALGARVHTSAPVRAVAAVDGGFRVSFEARGVRAELEARTVALTLPAWALPPLVAPLGAVAPAAAVAAAAAAAIDYVPVALAYLAYDAAAFATPPSLYGFFAADAADLAGAVFSSAVFTGRAPTDRVLVAVRLGGARGRFRLDDDDATLAARAHAALAPLCALRAAPVGHFVVRDARALPLYTLGHAARVAAADAAERALPGLFIAGNAWRGLGVADCVDAAAATAERIAAVVTTRRAPRAQGGASCPVTSSV